MKIIRWNEAGNTCRLGLEVGQCTRCLHLIVPAASVTDKHGPNTFENIYIQKDVLFTRSNVNTNTSTSKYTLFKYIYKYI